MHVHIYAYTMLRYAKLLAKGTLGINLFIFFKKQKQNFRKNGQLMLKITWTILRKCSSLGAQ